MKRAITIIVLGLVICGCSRSQQARTFSEEMQLTLRAGRGELTDDEKSKLLNENHPILAQVGEPQMARLMAMFAKLEPKLHDQLLKDSYVKWKLADLSRENQDMTAEVIRFAMHHRGFTASILEDESSRRLISLVDADVGFAVVELPRTGQKVVSWFAFGSALPSPLWITIVNTPASAEVEYVQAHMQRLPLLRTMRTSTPPGDNATYLANGPSLLCSVSG